jgi:hypothetical protein
VKEEQDLEDLNDSAYDNHYQKKGGNEASFEEKYDDKQYQYEDLDVDIVDKTDYDRDDAVIQFSVQKNKSLFKDNNSIA